MRQCEADVHTYICLSAGFVIMHSVTAHPLRKAYSLPVKIVQTSGHLFPRQFILSRHALHSFSNFNG